MLFKKFIKQDLEKTSYLTVSIGLGSEPLQGGGSHLPTGRGFLVDGAEGPRLKPADDDKFDRVDC